jgi:hypothetical protein
MIMTGRRAIRVGILKRPPAEDVAAVTPLKAIEAIRAKPRHSPIAGGARWITGR